LYATNCQKKFLHSFQVFLIERVVGGFMGSNEKIDGRKCNHFSRKKMDDPPSFFLS
jgi:hypothetical protein